MSGLLLLTPMSLEARALRRGAPGTRIVRTGMGPRRARATAARHGAGEEAAVAVTGFAGALSPELAPGDVVIATELRRSDGITVATCPGAGVIAGLLARHGLRTHTGPIVSVRAPALGASRLRLAQTGAVAVDMESAWLAGAAAGRPFAVVRVVLDVPGLGPLAMLSSFIRGSRRLAQSAAALAEWADAVGPGQLAPAAPQAQFGRLNPEGRAHPSAAPG